MPGDTAYGTPVLFAAPTMDVPDGPRTRVYITPRPERRGAFCVRTCDGRFFPVPNTNAGEASNVSQCEAACPSAEMKLYSGADIGSARTEQGQTYATLANAFRFQREIVPTCSCNPGATTGLTPIPIEDDITLRTGDIVADDHGFKVAAVSGRLRRSILFRPLSRAKAQALGLTLASSR